MTTPYNHGPETTALEDMCDDYETLIRKIARSEADLGHTTCAAKGFLLAKEVAQYVREGCLYINPTKPAKVTPILLGTDPLAKPINEFGIDL